ncbi:histone acetyltransferase HAC12 isoform X2 [Camellia sinensis]|nr:histone acetyltransferase HAC12 isoform X2 [Camellia sinensis]XP_028073319.1 histone acetyltransferase HAC12 isoform X2 [Camellia sinensis]
MSGQISGQVPNQAGTQLPGLPPQNGSSLSNHIQNLAGQCNTLNMEPELAKARRFMQEKIYDFLMQRQQRTNDIPPKRVLEIVRRLDEGLFRNAATKEEYLNLETLENRLHVLIKRLPMSTHNQQYPRLVNAPSPIGTMIPTPDSANSSVMVASAVDTSMIATGGGNSMPSVAVNTGSLLPPANGSSVGIHGGSFNSQVPANFLHEQNIQEEFHQRIAVQDEAQLSRIFKRHSIRE